MLKILKEKKIESIGVPEFRLKSFAFSFEIPLFKDFFKK